MWEINNEKNENIQEESKEQIKKEISGGEGRRYSLYNLEQMRRLSVKLILHDETQEIEDEDFDEDFTSIDKLRELY